jgi:hypothetical protein
MRWWAVSRMVPDDFDVATGRSYDGEHLVDRQIRIFASITLAPGEPL